MLTEGGIHISRVFTLRISAVQLYICTSEHRSCNESSMHTIQMKLVENVAEIKILVLCDICPLALICWCT